MSLNRLSSEKSPYLKQHASNPVWWYAWNEEAFQAAREQQKPIFLSIGYATCYWCHVMEKDSFERQEVAEVMNDLFICIKVDREERPDVDRNYMDTVLALTGHGGWPLSVALTPELKPYWAGTFFYKDQFIQILKALAKAWRDDKAKVIESADEITREIFKETLRPENTELSGQAIVNAVGALRGSFDPDFGGFGPAPKFPPPFQLGILLRFLAQSRDTSQVAILNSVITTTLDNMIQSGIHDQIGGGFHRYATDARWLIPHFEKMLYDNAQLCHLLCEVYQYSGQNRYLDTAKGIADYVLRELIAGGGAFYAAEDAGEVGKEGEFYVFQFADLKHELSSDEFAQLVQVFDISEAGNFEHGSNILARKPGVSQQLWEQSYFVRKKLLAIRSKRQRPLTDTKILTSWNALMIRALVKLYEVSCDDKYLNAAKLSADFILNNLWKSDRLLRRYADGEAGIAACLEDYAFCVEALLELFCFSGEQRWVEAAVMIQDAQDRILWNDKVGAYHDSSAPELISKKIELTDGATPAGNSVAAKNLLVFSQITANQSLRAQAKRIFLNFSETFEHYPHAACRALQALDLYNSEPEEIVVSGVDQDAQKIADALSRQFRPHSIQIRLGKFTISNPQLVALLVGKDPKDQSMIYICQRHVCKAPLTAHEFLKSF